MSITPPPPTSTLRDAVTANIRAELARHKTTSAEVAKYLGRESSWLTRKLRGDTKFTTDDIDDVARALGIDVDVLTETKGPHS